MDKIQGNFRLQNLGNTCFINSIIQILSHMPIFREYILTCQFVDILKRNSKDDDEDEYKIKFKDNIIYELTRLLSSGYKNPDCNITPTTFKKTVSTKLSEDQMFVGTEQHDSHELLTFLLDKLMEETSEKIIPIGGRKLKSIENSSLNTNLLKILAKLKQDNFIKKDGHSFLNSLFTSNEYVTIECDVCGHIVHKYQPYNFLELSIPIKNERDQSRFTLHDCLDNYVKPEKLDKDNMYKCQICCYKSTAKRLIQLHSTPKILIIHLKRFMKNIYGVTSRKIKNLVDFPIKNFNMQPYLFEKKSCKYNLIAVNKHIELSDTFNIGHYVSFCKNEYDNNWYKYNDNNPIHKVESIDELKNNAYILVYYKVN